MNEDLQLKDGTKWLRIAATCPNADAKAFLARILMHKVDDPDAIAEVTKIIGDFECVIWKGGQAVGK